MSSVDVLVVGAGPTGSTAAQLLARRGMHVRVIDRDAFPRFHIGESLLPCDVPLFEQLGVDTTGPAFLHKAGAVFVDEAGGREEEYLFCDGLPGTEPHAYQVDRSQFDEALLGLARDAGCEVQHGVRAEGVELRDDCIELATSMGVMRARYVLDATGQQCWSARRGRTLTPIHRFGRAAVFRHYENLSDSVWADIVPKGNIRIHILQDGWAWFIPLAGQRLSIGVVTRSQGMTPGLLDATIAASPELSAAVAGAAPGETRSIGNFSYRNEQPYAARLGCIGDAALFLDPVFSSGVSLGMLGAEKAAGMLSDALDGGDEADPELLKPLTDHMSVAYTAFGTLVNAFYHTGLVDNFFFAESPIPELRQGLISMLAGDVWRDDNLFQKTILESKRRYFDPLVDNR